MNKYGILIHGGAGTILKSKMTPEKEAGYRSGLDDALQAGYKILEKGGSAIDASVSAVETMEENRLFNAGVGAVFTHDGSHEQDACVMDGRDRSVGAIASVRRVKNPIKLARLVMEKSEHVLLAGEGAEKFAEANGMKLVADPSYFDTDFRRKQLEKALAEEKKSGESKVLLDHSDQSSKIGTVGAVAVDQNGNLAAATSTGGMTNKRHGRVGDTPIIGAGTFADNNTCAVSATGVGEYIMRAMVSYDIAALMEYKNMSLLDAANLVVMEKLTEIGGDGGVVAIDAKCNIAMPFNSAGMYHGYMLSDGQNHIGIFGE